MKSNLLQQLISMSRYAFFGILMQCWFCSMLLANDGLAQKKSVDEIFIAINLKNASLKEVLKTIEQKTEFKFVYNENVLDNYPEITVESNSRSLPLGKILRDVSKQTHLAFKRIDDNIHIRERKFSTKAVEEILSAHRPVQVTGTATSAPDGEGLPGVNVLVKNTTIGTVTDLDGKYSITEHFVIVDPL